MLLTCSRCNEVSTLAVKVAGRVEYAQCKNVFRVVYKYRMPCPKCHALLHLTPQGHEGYVGVPVQSNSHERTENLYLVDQEAKTMPRIQSASKADAVVQFHQNKPADPVPDEKTIRKTIIQRAKTLVKKDAFRMIEKTKMRPKPLRISLKEKKRGKPIPVFKFAMISVIALAISAAAALTYLAVATTSEPSVVVSPPSLLNPSIQTLEKDQAEKPLPPPEIKIQDETEETHDQKQSPPVSKSLSSVPEILFPRSDVVTSKFGPRKDPIHNGEAFHNGVDVRVPNRSEVLAALEGEVKYVGWKGGYGKVVILEHSDGYETLYGHLSRVLVKQGSKIRQGELIALVGSTGRSTAPHLHFEVTKKGKRIDPLRLELISKVMKS